MFKGVTVVLVSFGVLLSLSGCATARKQQEMQIQELKNQITVLESQVQSKDQEILSLKEALDKPVVSQNKGIIESGKVVIKKVTLGEAKSRPSVRQIQLALQNAGYNPGDVDGKMGRQTKDAIRAFQRANNLPADGRVGKRTWFVLKKYLYQRVK